MAAIQSNVKTILTTAGVAAFGASFGRDVYRFGKRYIFILAPLLLAGFIIYLPYKGAKIATVSGPYFTWRWTFRSAIPGALLGIIGFVILSTGSLIISDSFTPSVDPNPGLMAILWMAALTALLASIGAFRGWRLKQALDRS